MLNPRTMSDEGVRLLTSLEGFMPRAYPDTAGALTIGVGHLLTPRERERGVLALDNPAAPSGFDVVPWQQGLTPTQVHRLLAQDLRPRIATLHHLVTVALTQPQLDALLCFLFNIGEEAFRHSALLQLLNQGIYDAVPGQMLRWNRVKGVVSAGLTARRHHEIARWNTPAPQETPAPQAQRPAAQA